MSDVNTTWSLKVSLKNKLKSWGIQLFSVVQDKNIPPNIQIKVFSKVKKKNKLTLMT